MGRILIWTAPQVPIGEMVADVLRDKGLPVTTVPTNTGDMYPTPFLEVWLEDEELLQDEEVQRTIQDAIEAHPISEAEAEAIEEMPFVDEPEKPLVTIPKNTMPIVVAGIILVVALLVYVVWRSTRSY